MITMEACRDLDKRVKSESYDKEKVKDDSIHMTIKNLVETGMYIYEIGAAVGMNRSTVYDCLRRMGINKKSNEMIFKKRPGNRINHPQRKIKPVYSFLKCRSCGDDLLHFMDVCNWCRGKNREFGIFETRN